MPSVPDILIYQDLEYPTSGSTGAESLAMPTLRTVIDSWPRGIGFSQGPPPASFLCSNFAKSLWCPRCNHYHTSSYVLSKLCFACGRLGHLRKDCPTLCGYSSAHRGIGRQTLGIVPSEGPAVALRQSASTTQPAMTQASVQQCKKMNALAQQEADK